MIEGNCLSACLFYVRVWPADELYCNYGSSSRLFVLRTMRFDCLFCLNQKCTRQELLQEWNTIFYGCHCVNRGAVGQDCSESCRLRVISLFDQNHWTEWMSRGKRAFIHGLYIFLLDHFLALNVSLSLSLQYIFETWVMSLWLLKTTTIWYHIHFIMVVWTIQNKCKIQATG